MRFRFVLPGVALFLFTIHFVSAAESVTASLAQMPVYAESKDKGVLVDMVKALEKASGTTIEYDVVPFKRSMDNVITKKVDFHAPLIKNPTLDESTLDYDHSTATIFHVNFVLYTNKSKPVDRNKLEGLTIETDAAHTQYFPFKTVASSDLAASLKKLNAGRIDAFIFADMASDPIIKDLGLSNIDRQLYERFDVKIILPKGQRGGTVDKMISSAKAKLEESGEWEKIMGVLDQPYKD